MHTWTFSVSFIQVTFIIVYIKGSMLIATEKVKMDGSWPVPLQTVRELPLVPHSIQTE